MKQKRTTPQSLQKIEDALGQPAYKREGVLIYQCDCLEGMGELPSPLFDLTVTSPPYNIGKEYENPLSVEEYIDWCAEWIAEVFRLTRDGGAFWLNVGYLSLSERAKALPIPYLLWDKVPFYLIQEIVWHYGAGVAARKSFSPRNEKFLWYVKDSNDYTFNLDDVRDPNVKYPNQKKNGKLKCNSLGKNPSDVWLFPKVTSGKNRSSKERMPHPAQFPVAVIERIIKACTDRNALILDPFIGSGSTAEVALQNDRAVVGFEIDAQYVQVAASRLDAYFERRRYEASQLDLFDIVGVVEDD